MSPEDKKLMRQLKKLPAGQALIRHLERELAVIGDIRQATSWEDTKGRQFAIKIITNIFTAMEEEKEEEKKTPNQYI